MTLKKYTTTVVSGLLLLTMSCEQNGTFDKSVSPAAKSQTKSADLNGARVSNYTFDGTEGDPITSDTATNWVANYVTTNPFGAKAYFFGSAALKNILVQSGCMGIRIYYGLDDLGKQQLLLIGADVNGNNLSPASGISGKVSAVTLLGGQDSFGGTEGNSVSAETTKQWMANLVSASIMH